MITAAPILSYFTTNYMGTGYFATSSTRALNGDVIREKAEQSARHPPLCGRPPRGPTKSAWTTTSRENSAQSGRGRFLGAKIGVSKVRP